MIINAENLILGRLSTVVAKKALLGESIEIINVEKAVIVGSREMILDKYKQRRERGDPKYGPYFPRTPERLVKRAIRGMLPYKQSKGRQALERIKCHEGIPKDLKDKKAEIIQGAKLSPQKMKYLTIKELSKNLGNN
jgi:large subunit ribosomal protein L13|tara:strand:+ start:22025 stop:22435 length:411 start_codon:yes stop_codon:yes gene_type:complete